MNVKIAGATIEDIAASVSGSTWWKRISGDGRLSAEIADTIAKSDKLGYNINNYFEDLSQNLMTQGNIDKDAAEAIAKKIKPGDIDKSVEKIAKSQNMDEKSIELMKRIAKDTNPEKYKIHAKDMSLLQAASEYPRAYFGIADEATRKTRIKTAVAGYAGAAVGGRVLSGGSLTKDEYGRGDIAGIPFI